MDPVQTVLAVAEQGNEQAMAVFLEQGRANVCDQEGFTPLMAAAANGKESTVRMLLQNQAEVNRQNQYGWTALMQAACHGHLPATMLLLQHGAEVNNRNSWGTTALVGAAQGGFLTIVQVLLKEGAEVNSGVEVSSLTALMAASQRGHTETVSHLITSGENVNTQHATTGWTALMLAAINNQPSVVELLLKHGADQEMCDINGKKAAELASALGRNDVVCLLSGERPNNYSENDFFEAVKAGAVERVREMLAHMRSLANCLGEDETTPLMFAANKGHTEVCELLLQAEAEVNAKDSLHGWTALMQATHQKKYAVVQLLGQYGADVSLRGKTGSTAFDIANMIGDIEMIRIIANITVERIQRKSSPEESAETTPSTRATLTANSSSKLEPVKESKESHVAPGGVANGPKAPGKRNAPPLPIDAAELVKRLQDAYRSPEVPTLSIPSPMSASTEEARFPLPRTRKLPSNPPSLNSSLDNPDSTSSSISLISSNQRGRASPSLQGFNPDSALAKLLSKGSLGDRERSKLVLPVKSRSTHSSPQNSSRFTTGLPLSKSRNEMPSFLQKYADLSREPRSPALLLHPSRASSQKSLEVKSPTKLRSRSFTDPSFHSSPLKAKKPSLKPLGNPGADLKKVLEGASLGRHYSLFAEQEVDYQLFITFSDSDLRELGILRSEERGRLLALIARLNTEAQAIKSAGPSERVGATPIFVFQ